MQDGVVYSRRGNVVLTEEETDDLAAIQERIRARKTVWNIIFNRMLLPRKRRSQFFDEVGPVQLSQLFRFAEFRDVYDFASCWLNRHGYSTIDDVPVVGCNSHRQELRSQALRMRVADSFVRKREEKMKNRDRNLARAAKIERQGLLSKAVNCCVRSGFSAVWDSLSDSISEVISDFGYWMVPHRLSIMLVRLMTKAFSVIRSTANATRDQAIAWLLSSKAFGISFDPSIISTLGDYASFGVLVLSCFLCATTKLSTTAKLALLVLNCFEPWYALAFGAFAFVNDQLIERQGFAEWAKTISGVNSGVTFLKNLSSIVVGLFDTAYEWFYGYPREMRSLSPIFEKMTAWMDEVPDIDSLTSRPDVEKVKLALKHLAKGQELNQQTVGRNFKGYTYAAFTNALAIFATRESELKRILKCARTNAMPVGVLVIGAPGVGKDTVLPSLARAVWTAFTGETLPASELIFRYPDANNKFPGDLYFDQPVCWFEDLCYIQTKEGVTDAVTQAKDVLNAYPKELVASNVHEKGSKFTNFSLVWMTTNATQPWLDADVADIGAFYRRVPIILQAVSPPRSEYQGDMLFVPGRYNGKQKCYEWAVSGKQNVVIDIHNVAAMILDQLRANQTAHQKAIQDPLPRIIDAKLNNVTYREGTIHYLKPAQAVFSGVVPASQLGSQVLKGKTKRLVYDTKRASSSMPPCESERVEEDPLVPASDSDDSLLPSEFFYDPDQGIVRQGSCPYPDSVDSDDSEQEGIDYPDDSWSDDSYLSESSDYDSRIIRQASSMCKCSYNRIGKSMGEPCCVSCEKTLAVPNVDDLNLVMHRVGVTWDREIRETRNVRDRLVREFVDEQVGIFYKIKLERVRRRHGESPCLYRDASDLAPSSWRACGCPLCIKKLTCYYEEQGMLKCRVYDEDGYLLPSELNLRDRWLQCACHRCCNDYFEFFGQPIVVMDDGYGFSDDDDFDDQLAYLNDYPDSPDSGSDSDLYESAQEYDSDQELLDLDDPIDRQGLVSALGLSNRILDRSEQGVSFVWTRPNVRSLRLYGDIDVFMNSWVQTIECPGDPEYRITRVENDDDHFWVQKVYIGGILGPRSKMDMGQIADLALHSNVTDVLKKLFAKWALSIGLIGLAIAGVAVLVAKLLGGVSRESDTGRRSRPERVHRLPKREIVYVGRLERQSNVSQRASALSDQMCAVRFHNGDIHFQSRGLFVNQEFLLVPKHLIDWDEGHDSLEIYRNGEKQTFSPDELDFVLDEASDVCLVRLCNPKKHFPRVRDILSSFVSDSKGLPSTFAGVTFVHDTRSHLTKSNAPLNLVQAVQPATRNPLDEYGWWTQTTVETNKGDCGMPYLANDGTTSVILGIHAGVMNGRSSKKFMALTTRETISQMMSFFVDRQSSIVITAVDSNPALNLEYVAPRGQQYRMPHKNKVEPSPVCGAFIEPQKLPTQIGLKEGYSPLVHALSTYPTRDVTPLSEDYWIFANLRLRSKVPSPRVRARSLEEFLPMLKPDLTSSSGYPFNTPMFSMHHKGDLLFLEVTDSGNRYTFHPFLRDDMLCLADAVCGGLRVGRFFEGCLKAETRVPEKADKPRLFFIGPISHFLLTSWLLDPVLQSFLADPVMGPNTIGINPHGIQWARLKKRFEGKQVLDMDMKAMDKLHSRQEIEGLISLATSMMEEAHGSPFLEFTLFGLEHRARISTLVRVLVEEATVSPMLINNLVVSTTQPQNFSGSIITWMVNMYSLESASSLALYRKAPLPQNVIYPSLESLAYAKYHSVCEAEKNGDFWIDDTTHGDDLLLACKGFDVDEIVECYKLCGLHPTPALKDEALFQFKSIEACTFLQRSFVSSPNGVHAPLPEWLIDESFNYWEKGVEFKEWLRSVSLNALREWSHHPRPLFDKKRDEILRLCKSYDVDVLAPSYHQIIVERGVITGV
jgi:hypothetical protein